MLKKPLILAIIFVSLFLGMCIITGIVFPFFKIDSSMFSFPVCMLPVIFIGWIYARKYKEEMSRELKNKVALYSSGFLSIFVIFLPFIITLSLDNYTFSLTAFGLLIIIGSFFATYFALGTSSYWFAKKYRDK